MAAKWRLQMFGEVCLHGPGEQIRHFGTVRATKLLVLLGLSRNGRMRREQLAELLWPDDFYDATRLRLRQEAHRLKKSLGNGESLLDSNSQELILDRSDLETDLDVLGRLIENPVLELPSGIESSLFAREFLGNWDEHWAFAERGQAEALQLRAAVALGEHWVENGLAQRALDLSRLFISRYPTDESIRMVAVRAHGSLGSMANAVAEYQEYRRLVRDAQGIDPSPQAESVLQQIMEPSAKPASTASGARLRAEVPTPIDRIVGRVRELGQIREMLGPQSSTRLLTLTGPGGIGKTRLALEAAVQFRDQTDTKIGFVSLVETTEADQWARATLDQLAVQAPPDSDALSYLIRLLQSETLVLVLDNLEHLLPGIASDLKRLLEAAPRLKILATSRSPVGLHGEASLPVGPLDPQREGRAFLLEALRIHRPLAATQVENSSALETLSRRLDGYPLAMRLAAARFRSLSPAQLLHQLEMRPDVLTGGGIDMPDRHQSLDKALSWSLETLSDRAKEAIKQLVTCPGGTGLDLANLILETPETVEVLEELLDTALLQLDDRGTHVRFRMLVPIREFIRSTLDPADWASRVAKTSRAIRRFVEEQLPTSDAPLTESRLIALDEEHENIQVTMEWGLNHEPSLAFDIVQRIWTYENSRAHQRDLGRVIDELRPLCEDRNLRITLNMIQTNLLVTLTDAEAALPFLLEAESLIDDGTPEALRVQVALTRSAWTSRNRESTRWQDALNAEAAAHALGDPYILARAQHHLGLLAMYTRNYEVAERKIRSAYLHFQKVADVMRGGASGSHLAFILNDLNRMDEALRILADARVVIKLGRDPIRLAFLSEVDGRIAMKEERFVEAEAAFRDSLAVWTSIGSEYQQADQLLSITRSLIPQRRYSEAQTVLVESAELWFKGNDWGGLCQCIHTLSSSMRETDRIEHSRELMAYAVKFDIDHDCLLVQPELEYRDRVKQGLGDLGEHLTATSPEEAYAFFTSLRR